MAFMSSAGLVCPKCGSNNIDVQLHQENLGEKTVTKTKSKYKQKGHGFLWWIFIGSWWWMVDLMLWVCFFPLKLIRALTKKKKYVASSKSVANTSRNVEYRTMCLCKNCGHHWKK